MKIKLISESTILRSFDFYFDVYQWRIHNPNSNSQNDASSYETDCENSTKYHFTQEYLHYDDSHGTNQSISGCNGTSSKRRRPWVDFSHQPDVLREFEILLQKLFLDKLEICHSGPASSSGLSSKGIETNGMGQQDFANASPRRMMYHNHDAYSSVMSFTVDYVKHYCDRDKLHTSISTKSDSILGNHPPSLSESIIFEFIEKLRFAVFIARMSVDRYLNCATVDKVNEFLDMLIRSLGLILHHSCWAISQHIGTEELIHQLDIDSKFHDCISDVRENILWIQSNVIRHTLVDTLVPMILNSMSSSNGISNDLNTESATCSMACYGSLLERLTDSPSESKHSISIIPGMGLKTIPSHSFFQLKIAIECLRSLYSSNNSHVYDSIAKLSKILHHMERFRRSFPSTGPDSLSIAIMAGIFCTRMSYHRNKMQITFNMVSLSHICCKLLTMSIPLTDFIDFYGSHVWCCDLSISLAPSSDEIDIFPGCYIIVSLGIRTHLDKKTVNASRNASKSSTVAVIEEYLNQTIWSDRTQSKNQSKMVCIVRYFIQFGLHVLSAASNESNALRGLGKAFQNGLSALLPIFTRLRDKLCTQNRYSLAIMDVHRDHNRLVSKT